MFRRDKGCFQHCIFISWRPPKNLLYIISFVVQSEKKKRSRITTTCIEYSFRYNRRNHPMFSRHDERAMKYRSMHTQTGVASFPARIYRIIQRTHCNRLQPTASAERDHNLPSPLIVRAMSLTWDHLLEPLPRGTEVCKSPGNEDCMETQLIAWRAYGDLVL